MTDGERASAWDAQYRGARWDYLATPEQRPRYDAVAAAVRGPGGPQHVLDLGCGTGLLRAALPETGIASYTGVDFSAEALDRARDEAPAGDVLVHADIGRWTPPRSFDAIVLNEALYYVDDPRGLARRYGAALAPGGALIVSMYVPPWRRGLRWRGRIEAIWWQLRRDHDVVSSHRVPTAAGARRWRIERLRPRAPR